MAMVAAGWTECDIPCRLFCAMRSKPLRLRVLFKLQLLSPVFGESCTAACKNIMPPYSTLFNVSTSKQASSFADSLQKEDSLTVSTIESTCSFDMHLCRIQHDHGTQHECGLASASGGSTKGSEDCCC